MNIEETDVKSPLQRRRQEKEEICDWLKDDPPNFFLTLTFSPTTSFSTARTFRHKAFLRILRNLLGPRFNKKLKQQPYGISFAEAASSKFQASSLGAPHYHILLWVSDELTEKLKEIDITQLWQRFDPHVTRTAHIAHLGTTQAQHKVIEYVTKHYEQAPEEIAFIGTSQN